jgi:hypothetical protein
MKTVITFDEASNYWKEAHGKAMYWRRQCYMELFLAVMADLAGNIFRERLPTWIQYIYLFMSLVYLVCACWSLRISGQWLELRNNWKSKIDHFLK